MSSDDDDDDDTTSVSQDLQNRLNRVVNPPWVREFTRLRDALDPPWLKQMRAMDMALRAPALQPIKYACGLNNGVAESFASKFGAESRVLKGLGQASSRSLGVGTSQWREVMGGMADSAAAIGRYRSKGMNPSLGSLGATMKGFGVGSAADLGMNLRKSGLGSAWADFRDSSWSKVGISNELLSAGRLGQLSKGVGQFAVPFADLTKHIGAASLRGVEPRSLTRLLDITKQVGTEAHSISQLIDQFGAAPKHSFASLASRMEKLFSPQTLFGVADALQQVAGAGTAITWTEWESRTPEAQAKAVLIANGLLESSEGAICDDADDDGRFWALCAQAWSELCALYLAVYDNKHLIFIALVAQMYLAVHPRVSSESEQLPEIRKAQERVEAEIESLSTKVATQEDLESLRREIGSRTDAPDPAARERLNQMALAMRDGHGRAVRYATAIKSGPDGRSRSLLNLPAGAMVVVGQPTECRRGWCRVLTLGTDGVIEGWILKKAIRSLRLGAARSSAARRSARE